MEAAAYCAEDVRLMVTRFPVTLVRLADGSRLGAISEAGLETALTVLFQDGRSRVSISYR